MKFVVLTLFALVCVAFAQVDGVAEARDPLNPIYTVKWCTTRCQQRCKKDDSACVEACPKRCQRVHEYLARRAARKTTTAPTVVAPVVATKNVTAVDTKKATKYFKGLLERNPRIVRVADRVRRFKDLIKKLSTDKKGDSKQVATLKKVLRALAAREEKRAVKDLQQLVKRRCTRELKGKKGAKKGSKRGSKKGSKKASKKVVAKVNKVMSDSAFFKKLFSKVLPIIKNIGLTALKSGAIAAIA
jgi:uncharacterized membrane-anchored protein YjiN (DUF445 family)